MMFQICVSVPSHDDEEGRRYETVIRWDEGTYGTVLGIYFLRSASEGALGNDE